jgi:hypothetical protein
MQPKIVQAETKIYKNYGTRQYVYNAPAIGHITAIQRMQIHKYKWKNSADNSCVWFD